MSNPFDTVEFATNPATFLVILQIQYRYFNVARATKYTADTVEQAKSFALSDNPNSVIVHVERVYPADK